MTSGSARRYRTSRPSRSASTSPADRSTARCCETFGWLAPSSSARRPTSHGPSASRWRISRRRGLASVLRTSAWSAMISSIGTSIAACAGAHQCRESSPRRAERMGRTRGGRGASPWACMPDRERDPAPSGTRASLAPSRRPPDPPAHGPGTGRTRGSTAERRPDAGARGRRARPLRPRHARPGPGTSPRPSPPPRAMPATGSPPCSRSTRPRATEPRARSSRWPARSSARTTTTRTTEAGYTLANARFAGNKRLQEIAGGGSALGKSDKAAAVKPVQTALLDLGYTLLLYKDDGSFGDETTQAISQFRTDRGVTGGDGMDATRSAASTSSPRRPASRRSTTSTTRSCSRTASST